jgi:hypothetical protein
MVGATLVESGRLGQRSGVTPEQSEVGSLATPHAKYRTIKMTPRIAAASQSQPLRPIRASRCRGVGRRR